MRAMITDTIEDLFLSRIAEHPEIQEWLARAAVAKAIGVRNLTATSDFRRSHRSLRQALETVEHLMHEAMASMPSDYTRIDGYEITVQDDKLVWRLDESTRRGFTFEILH